MERLTARTEDGEVIYSGNVIDKSLDYEQTILDRLAELEDKLESGRMLELPFPEQPYAYHIVKSVSKYKKVVWLKRRITWASLIYGIAYRGNDGLYFQTAAQAEVRLKELKEQKNG